MFIDQKSNAGVNGRHLTTNYESSQSTDLLCSIFLISLHLPISSTKIKAPIEFSPRVFAVVTAAQGFKRCRFNRPTRRPICMSVFQIPKSFSGYAPGSYAECLNVPKIPAMVRLKEKLVCLQSRKDL